MKSDVKLIKFFERFANKNFQGKITAKFFSGFRVDYEIFDISKKVLRPEALSGLYIANDIGPREAMRAGVLTMRGTAIASKKSGWLDEILGPGGYFLIDDDTDLNRLIKFGLGEKGRHMAMAARHFLKSRRSHEKCADSIMTLYRKINAQ